MKIKTRSNIARILSFESGGLVVTAAVAAGAAVAAQAEAPVHTDAFIPVFTKADINSDVVEWQTHRVTSGSLTVSAIYRYYNTNHKQSQLVTTQTCYIC